MPIEQEVIDRLTSYCARLEDDLGVALHRRHLPAADPTLPLDNDVTAEDSAPAEVREVEHGRRWGALAAAVVFVAVGIGVLAVLESRRVDQRPDGSVAPAATAGAATTPAPTSSIGTVPATTAVTEPTTTVLPGALLRPFVDPNLCAPLAVTGDGDATGSTFDLHLFARATQASSFPIQIIGDPNGGPTAPFALLQRYPEQSGPGQGQGQTIRVNDWDVALGVFGNGNGDGRWGLPDGGEGYLRSRGLDRDSLVAIISSLTARDATAAIPGFDYTPGPSVPATLQLLVEHLNTGVYGRGAGLRCQVASTNFLYRISALDGDPVFQYALVIDRPVPLEVGYQYGTLVIIEGLADPTAPSVADVVNADPPTWNNLPHAPAL